MPASEHPPERARARDPTTVDPAIRYMLDSNAFDYLLDRGIDARAVRRLGTHYITTVQHRELLEVPDAARRKRLLRVLSGIDPIVRPCPDSFRQAALRAGVGTGRRGSASNFEPERREFREKSARWKDAAIAEVARTEGCTLVTDDGDFRRRAAESGLIVVACAEAFVACRTGPAEASCTRAPSPSPRRRSGTRATATAKRIR